LASTQEQRTTGGAVTQEKKLSRRLAGRVDPSTMVKFFQAGGFNMWVLAGLGIALWWNAIRFARNADAQRLSVIRALTWALVFSTLAGFAAALGTTAVNSMRIREQHPEYPLVELLLSGFAESTTNVTLGGGIGVITWILVSVGLRRMPGDRS
jgi:hypothetical protein